MISNKNDEFRVFKIIFHEIMIKKFLNYFSKDFNFEYSKKKM